MPWPPVSRLTTSSVTWLPRSFSCILSLYLCWYPPTHPKGSSLFLESWVKEMCNPLMGGGHGRNQANSLFLKSWENKMWNPLMGGGEERNQANSDKV